MNTAELVFISTGTTLTISVVVAVAAFALCIWAWHKSRYSFSIALLETLRFVIVCLVLVTLNQPEWVEEHRGEEEPVVAVLWDNSPSMATRDVLDPGGAASTRAEWLAPQLQPETWRALEGIAEVVIEPLGADGSAGTDLSTPLKELLDEHPSLRAVVLFSDGDWNLGVPPAESALAYRTRQVPIFTHVVGSPLRLPDLEITSLEAPIFAIAGKALQIPFSIRSALAEDVTVTVRLLGSDGGEREKEVVIPAKGVLQDFVTWEAERAGTVNLTLRVPVQNAELLSENNERSVELDVREEALQILLVDSYPRWEYRYFRNALVRDPGTEVSCLMFHPDLEAVGGGPHYIEAFPEPAALSAYDVVFLGDVGIGTRQLSVEDCAAIRGLVQEQASGLILMPGFRGYQFSLLETELAELFPVQLDAAVARGHGSAVPGSFALTESGRRSLLTKLIPDDEENSELWEQLPGFQWYGPVLRAKAGTEVLAVHRRHDNEYGRIPLIVTKPFGTGKVLFMGTDGAWRWREGVEDKYHYRFWGQVVRWMAYQRQMTGGETMRLYYSPDRPQVGTTLTLNVNVMDSNGAPVEGGNVVARITTPAGESERIRLRGTPGEWGLYTGRFSPEEGGTHAVTVTCAETGEELGTEIEVIGSVVEKTGEPARPEVLAEVARLSRGESFDGSAVAAVIDRLRALPEPPVDFRRFQLWNNPIWAGALIFLMGLFWVGRKMVGRI